MTTVPHDEVRVTVGVDTHEDVHVAVALDQLGRWLGETSIPTNTGGFVRLVDWASEFGVTDKFGVEGTGSRGAGLEDLLASLSIFPGETARMLARLGAPRNVLEFRDASAQVDLPEGESPILDADAQKMVDAAFATALEYDRRKVAPEHLLYGVLTNLNPWLQWRLWSRGFTPTDQAAARHSLKL